VKDENDQTAIFLD